jgi:hypothetical protein
MSNHDKNGETPRTDALIKQDWHMPKGWKDRIHEHARQLERELDQAEDYLVQTEGVASMYEKRLGPCEHSRVKCAQCSLEAAPSASEPPEGWNLVCEKCGSSPDGPCGWPSNCPTGLDKRIHDIRERLP